MTNTQIQNRSSTFKQVYQEQIGFLQYAVARFRLPVQIQEDLIQEAFLRYIEYMEENANVNPKHFLLAVLRNLSIDYYRKQKRRGMDKHMPIEEFLGEIPLESKNLEELQAVQNFLTALKDDPQASTLVQYYDEDLTIREIADRTQESIATVSSRLSRQRKKYRPFLESCLNA